MPSYQVPQFLDSGDKILWTLSVRQFAYALIGGLTAFISIQILQKIIGFIPALIIVAPFVFLMAFIAIGKYNGRDAEIYVFKFIEYLKKQKNLMFRRVPYSPELDKRLSHLNYNYLSNTLDRRLQDKLQENQFRNHFSAQPALAKIATIKSLSQKLEKESVNEMVSIQQLEQQNQAFAEANFNTPETTIYKKVSQLGTKLVAHKS